MPFIFVLFVLLVQLSVIKSSVLPSVKNGVIIGGGRVGNLLLNLNNHRDILLTRESPIVDVEGPYYVCVRNDDLDRVVERTPKHRRGQLVFLQNGVLDGFLDRYGLSDNTQALIYFAVAKKGDEPIDGKTETDPQGLTAACGRYADDLAARLRAGDLSCRLLDRTAFRSAMLEKHVWISAFMALGVKYNCGIRSVERDHFVEVRELIRELSAAASVELSVPLTPGLEDRLCAYAKSVGHFPAAVKEFKWRNGWFKELSERAGFSDQCGAEADPCPLHSSLMQLLGL